MSLFEWWDSLGLVSQIFYCIAVPSTLVLVIQTVLLFMGFDDGADSEFDVDAPDADFDDGILGDDGMTDISDVSGLESLHIFTVRGIIAFLVVFGWVGYGMEISGVKLWITILVSTVCGFMMMTVLAFFVRTVMKLKNDGNLDNRNALGVSGKVYLTVPANRKGEGKVNVMLQGSFVERDAVTDENEDIPTGCEVVVTGVSGQTTLVVNRK